MTEPARGGPASSAGPTPDGASRSRAVWAGTLVDQVLSGASNVLAVVLVARVLDASDFGRFALAYTALVFTLGLIRLYLGNRLVLAQDDDSVWALTGALLGAVVLISPLLVGGVLAVSLLAVGSASTGLVLVVALVTPVVCAQDLVRLACASAGRPVPALVSDVVWLLIMGVAILLPGLSATAVLGVWAGAAVAAAVLALVLTGQRPRLAAGVAELRRRDLEGGSLAVGGAVSSASSLVLLWMVALFVSDTGAGSLRGASTLMGPINVLFAFSAAGVTAVLVRRARDGDLRFCAVVAAALVAASLAWGGVLLALPGSAGEMLLGESWPGARSVLPWTVLEYVLLSVSTAATVGQRARRQGSSVMSAQLLRSAVALGGGVLAVALGGGAVAVAAVLAVAAGVGSAWAWYRLRQAGFGPGGSGSSAVPADGASA